MPPAPGSTRDAKPPLRAVKACVRDDRLPANVAAIKDADAGIPLQAICGQPEARHEFTLLCHTR